MNETTDEDLAHAAAQGNLAAFETLLKRHSGPLLLFCRHLLQDAAAAEDVVQETFLRVHVHLHRYDPSRRFSSWITSIAHNLCRDALRIRGRERTAAAPEPAPVVRPESDPRADSIQDQVSRLPAKHRAILFQKFRLGLNASEIAERLGLSASDVRTSLHRILNVLKRSFVR
ncbi:MAG TPA: RNA polymerase sigma factor [Planctomycetota bacterium]|jgi:RNA polymerase sigma-70 factor (ECF subfamily)|nr:RNA polymerase sigma factor [Planctomycetota bacterium]